MVLRVLVALALVCSIAHADDKPWAKGVTAANQKTALGVYTSANELFEQSQFQPALDLYEQALKLWPHPAIYYNAAVCLKNLGRPVQALDYFEHALAYGDAPLGADLYAEGVKYRDDLDKQLAKLEIKVKESGASVSLDGKPVLDKPGSTLVRVTPGERHEVVARKSGFQTEQRAITLQPGKTTTLVLEMKLLEGSKWKPWAVVAAGGVIATVGGVLLAKSFDDYDKYDRAITAVCPCTDDADFKAKAKMEGGDTASDADADKRGRLEAITAYSAFAVGGATLAVGIYLVVRTRGKATVTPTASADHVGATFNYAW